MTKHSQFKRVLPASAPIDPATIPYSIDIPLTGNRLARLILPRDFTAEDLDRIMKFIHALRNDDEPQSASPDLAI